MSPPDNPLKPDAPHAEAPRKPKHFNHLIGLKVERAVGGRSSCWLDAHELLYNPAKILHGGVTFSLADVGMGAALYSILASHEYAITLEMKINYMKAVTTGRLDCETRVVERAGDMAVLESEVRTDGALVAKALGTYAILKRKQTKPEVAS
jgi:acyl-CoA thioesterase